MQMPKSLEEFWKVNTKFKSELQVLRKIMLDCGLTETFKWAFPTYMYKKKNVISLASFKEHYGIWFIQGVFLKDETKQLSNAQEGKTKAMRQWRFEDEELDVDEIKMYVLEAIDNCIAGKEVKVVIDTSYKMSSELKTALAGNLKLNEAFYTLTPGRQKEYANYINEAKQEKTKITRLEKIRPMILAGSGLNDKYK